ncbi:MAG: helix-turn-helix domain-containing protein [Phenylobacterium sp.]
MPETFESVLGKRLRWRRRALGLSLKDISPACGVRFQQIAKYESGSAQVSAAILWKLARALDVDISFFFDGLGDARVRKGPSANRAEAAEFADRR